MNQQKSVLRVDARSGFGRPLWDMLQTFGFRPANWTRTVQVFTGRIGREAVEAHVYTAPGGTTADMFSEQLGSLPMDATAYIVIIRRVNPPPR